MLTEQFWLIGSIAVPWALGACIIRACCLTRFNPPATLVLGFGFLFGMYIAAGVAWVSLKAGLGIPVRALVGAMAVIAVSVRALEWWRSFPVTNKPDLHRSRGLWPTIAMLVVSVAVLGPMLMDVWLRPLFPWDAWFSYAVKAKIIYFTDQLPELVGYNEWMRQKTPDGYYLSSTHPLTISLIQAWIAGAIGRWSESLINMPWPLLLLSMGLCGHGVVMQISCSRKVAALVFSLLVTVPAYGVHAVLAGYLDLWLGAWLMALTASLCLYIRHGGWGCGLLAGVAAVGCVASKDTAIAYLLPLAMAFSLALAGPKWRIAGLVLLTLAVSGLAFLFALDATPNLYLPLGGGQRIGFANGTLHVPLVKNYGLDGPFPVWGRLLDTLLLSRNFALLGWLLLAAIIFALLRIQRSAPAALLVTFGIVMAAILHFTLGYTHAGEILAAGTIDLRVLIPVTAAMSGMALCFVAEEMEMYDAANTLRREDADGGANP